MRTQARGRHGQAAWLCLAVLALGQLLAILHQATVVHVRCPVHGELVHADDAHAEAHAGAPAPSTLSGDPLRDDAVDDRLAATLGSGAHHDHEHCVVAVGVGKAVEIGEAGVRVAATGERAAPALPPLDAAIARGLYRLAPKTSPPV